jgi:hypothetical protein
MAWVVILEGPDGAAGDPRRDVFEVTPPPAPGREREELGRLVRGIHPGAEEIGRGEEQAVFDDGGRSLTARFARAGGGGPGAPAQGTLFDG